MTSRVRPGRSAGGLVRPIVLAALCTSIAVPGPVAANMGVPWDEGEPVAEPTALDEVAIVREDLAFDLRPVADGNPAQVTARYTVRNDGSPVDADLVFVSPGVDEGSVSIDGAAVSSQPVETDDLPESWMPPSSVPGIDGRPREYHVRGPEAIGFRLTIPPGQHELTVSYVIKPGAYHGASNTREYQLAYTLAPARTWQSFGSLDVTIELPPGWASATSLPLTREGATLRGHFDGLPADSIGLTFRPPESGSVPIGLGAIVAGTIGLAALGWLTGRAGRRRGWGVLAGFAIAIVLALGGAILLAVVAGLGMAAERSMTGGVHESRSHSYESGFFVFGAALLGLALGLLCGPLGLLVGYVRGRAAITSSG